MPSIRIGVCEALSRIPAFPPVANRVMNMLASGDAEIAPLVALIEKDPAFSVEILRLANSAAFSTTGRIKTLTQAIAQVGFSRLRSLTMTVALRSVMKVTLARPIVRQCWTHSLAAALIAKRFSRPAHFDAGEAYTVGLLHDIGRLGLLAAYPDEYGALLAQTYHSQTELMAAEELLLGLNHCAAGMLLIQQWNLAESLRAVTGEHHRTPDASTPPAVVLVNLACRLADCLGFGANTTAPPTIEEILTSASPELAKAIDAELPDLNINLVKELNALRLC